LKFRIWDLATAVFELFYGGFEEIGRFRYLEGFKKITGCKLMDWLRLASGKMPFKTGPIL
jgi:hypothetical protein